MRSLGTRRAAPVAGVATAAVIALAGCSAGQVAETAMIQAPVSGLNTASADGGLLIRNLQVLYNNPEGYPANGTAPLEVSLFNQTKNPMVVTITSPTQQTMAEGIVSARQVGIVGGMPSASGAPEPSGGGVSATPSEAPTASQASAAPSASATESAPPADAAQPARLTIAPLGSVSFLPGNPAKLQAIGLSNKLVPGTSVALTFQVSGSPTALDVLASVAVPLSPPSRAPGAEDVGVEG